MAKVGDKFIIEIDSHMTNAKGNLYGIKGFNSLVFDDRGLQKLKPYSEDAYLKGWADAIDAMRKAKRDLMTDQTDCPWK